MAGKDSKNIKVEVEEKGVGFKSVFADGVPKILSTPGTRGQTTVRVGALSQCNSTAVEEDESANNPFQEQIKKTRFCRYFTSGKCTRGNDCGFAHSTRELRKAPDLTKTSFCKLYKKGECTKSKEECPFAHGVHELRMTPMFEAQCADKTQKSKPKYTQMTSVEAPTSLPDVCFKQERAPTGPDPQNLRVEALTPQWYYAYPGQDSCASVPRGMQPPAMYTQVMPMVFMVAPTSPTSPSSCSSHHDYVGKMLKQAMPEYYED